ncbi:MAG: LytTR family DNA-binding domain-containing protein [Bacteroidia bacterium]|nr:LytTR family DNA-binding domain-containing protein [Bacteroidia bacterium]
MKILIIEDELNASQRLEKMIAEISPESEIVAVLDSVEAAVEWFRSHPHPDLILLDIHLADGSSFEIFSEVEVKVPIIFTTAYDEYAVKAFKVNSVDYLLKPVKKEELSSSLEKFRQIYDKNKLILENLDYTKLAAALEKNRTEYPQRMVIRYGQHIKAIEITEAAYFYVDSRVTFMKTHGGKSYPMDYNLDQLEAMLDPKKFFRINRKFIINISAIDQMYTYSKSRVKINLNPPVDDDTIVSSERAATFKRWLTGGGE